MEDSDHKGIMGKKYYDMMESFVKSDYLKTITENSQLVGIHSVEIYRFNSIYRFNEPEKSFIVLINRAEQDDRPLKCVVPYSNYYILWQKADYKKNVENPIIYYNADGAGVCFEYCTVDNREGVVYLETNSAVAEGDYYWQQLDPSISQLILVDTTQ